MVRSGQARAVNLARDEPDFDQHRRDLEGLKDCESGLLHAPDIGEPPILEKVQQDFRRVAAAPDRIRLT